MEDCNALCWIGTFLGLWLFVKVVDGLLRRPRVDISPSRRRYILVTGCDTGFGNEIARRLDRLGCYVFAGCLTEKGETELRKACSDRLVALSLDVTSQQSVRRAYDVVAGKLPSGQGLWGVLNNAGIMGRLGPSEWLSIADYEKVLAVNLLGLIDVTMTFLPLVKKSRGRIVNTSSVVGRFAFPGGGPYNISKYGVEAFTDGIRRSLRPYGCRASLIEPGFHQTHLVSQDNLNQMYEQSWKNASPEVRQEFGEEYFRHVIATTAKTSRVASPRISDVVDAYEHALLGRYPRARYVVGKDARYLWLPIQAMPEWLGDWILSILDFKKPLPAALRQQRS